MIIFVHELGHFTAGKLMGLKVKEFMFGLPGPRLFSFRRGETEYGATVIPFGGYVKFAGVESELQLEEDEEDKDTPPERKYDTQPRWKKALIMFAGPLMNMLFPILIFAIIFMGQGIQEATNVLSGVMKDSPASAAGLKAGDRIVAIDGKKVEVWEDVSSNLRNKAGEKVSITVERDGRTLKVEPTLREKKGEPPLGISSKIEYRRLWPHEAIYQGILATVNVIVLMVGTLYSVITQQPGMLVRGSAGPVGIVAGSAQIIEQSFWHFMSLIGFLSVNIGIVNLLPIPPLDGGRLAILGVEALKRNPINKRIVYAVNAVGMALLLTLMLYFVFADFFKIFSGIPPFGGG